MTGNSHKIKWLLLSVALLSVLWSLKELKALLVEQYPIRHVRIEGTLHYIDKAAINTAITPLLKMGYFFIDLHAIQQALIALPWSEQAQVKRIWPDRVELTITEKEPKVRWQSDSLLNSEGVIFKPLDIEQFEYLPILSVPNKQRVAFLKMMRFLAAELKKRGLVLSKFNVSERQSWLLSMDNNLLIQLGHVEPLDNFKQLMKVFDFSGAADVNKMAYVDMRYPNGYAVRWREDFINNH